MKVINLNLVLGKKVIKVSDRKEYTVDKIDKYIFLDDGSRFQLDAFENRYLIPFDEQLKKEMMDIIVSNNEELSSSKETLLKELETSANGYYEEILAVESQNKAKEILKTLKEIEEKSVVEVYEAKKAAAKAQTVFAQQHAESAELYYEDIRNIVIDANKIVNGMTASPICRRGRYGAIVSHPTISTIGSQLIQGQYYGTNGRVIYEICCDVFNWDKTLSGRFTWGHGMYAENATKEDFSVWFVRHSNWTNGRGGNWINEISDDLNEIKEVWNDVNDPQFLRDNSTRVVFAFRGYAYQFLGVYECVKIDTVNSVKILNKIKENYL